MKQATPMIAQYMAIKAKYPDALLFFRLGDFYEMFFEDAEIGSSELGIALTGRDAGEGRRAPMCGVPYHSVDEHIKTLISRGYKVAICEQVEDASKAKGLVKRDVVRVITPGTYWEGAEDSRSSYVAGLYVSESRTGLCAFDLSTGEVLVASFDGWDEVLDELERLRPGECVIPETLRDTSYCQALISRFKSDLFTISSVEDEKFYDQEGNGGLEATFGSEMAAKIKNRASPETFMAVKGLVNYVYSTQMNAPSHLKEPRFYKEEKVMEIDDDTRKNLELVQRIQEVHMVLYYGCQISAALPWVPGFENLVERPLCDRRGIEERLDAVEELTVNSNLRNTIRDSFKP